jgi:predicted nuclease with TOPRIM domain
MFKSLQPQERAVHRQVDKIKSSLSELNAWAAVFLHKKVDEVAEGNTELLKDNQELLRGKNELKSENEKLLREIDKLKMEVNKLQATLRGQLKYHRWASLKLTRTYLRNQ